MALEDVFNIVALLIDGLSRGFLYAILGLGITLVFGMGGILNLSIGVFMVIAILIVAELTGMVPLAVAMVLAVVLTAALGLGIERTLLKLVYRSEGEERLLLGIFVTLGLALALEGAIALNWSGPYSVHLEPPSWEIAGTFIRGRSLVVIGLALVVLFGMYLFFSRTKVGLATRTIMQDETGARLCGIDIDRMRAGIWTLSIAIAAFGGLLWGISSSADVGNTFALTTIAIVVAIVGGVTSIVGVVVAGVVLGVISTFLVAYGSTYLATISLFAIAIIVLLVKPEGFQ